MQWYFVAALLTILTSSQGILTTLSQSNGGYKYDYATVPFLAEIFKVEDVDVVVARNSQCQVDQKNQLIEVVLRHGLQVGGGEGGRVSEFQDLKMKKMIGGGYEKNGLYYFQPSAPVPGHPPISQVYVRRSQAAALLLVSSFLLWRECRASPPPRMTTEWKSVRLFPIPSVIYLIHNNVQFATLTYVDTSTYQIMGNLKIVTTAILFRLFLRRKLSNLQWMAIVLLAVGTTTSQVKGCGEVSCDSLFSAPIQGYMLGILSACLSALAGVYTEFLMKKNNDSLYWQNVQLYTFGSIFNMARLLLDDFRGGFEKGPWWQRIFNGYNMTTWMVVLNLGSTGLLVSWLMKYADNIVKVTPFTL
ncbi:hypothetical protein HHK36_029105 [Tetracentron sinense]|uniref:CMP-sialic acid transporter 1 n=1 Tax=Tetracentron sinense TaxID=13715 RepID=A0A835D395_TETSI|nr:hypothetical protein HHK36_029105 [Tetracentron sinense]